jgi:hypothetical protein
MNCGSVRGQLSAWMDEALEPAMAGLVNAHLEECEACRARRDEMVELRQRTAGMRRVAPSGYVRTSLRVIASREGVRRRRRLNLRTAVRSFLEDANLVVSNLLRPLAVPCAGGLASAVILFAALLPAFSTSPASRMAIPDVPIQLYTPASLKSPGPFLYTDSAVFLELTIDDQGRMVDYAITLGPGGIDSEELRRQIENALLFARFSPATSFGQPKSGRVLLTFTTSEINVIG